ncbi:MAG: CidA/LrgA family protein [Acidiferrobacterales bacterium]
MLNAITMLLVFQLVGEVISQASGLPIPGPVVGMLLLFLALHVRSAMVERLRETAQNMLQHLSLLFVPAGVGVMLHLRRVEHEWIAITLALVLSTVLTIVVTALTIRSVGRLIQTQHKAETRP